MKPIEELKKPKVDYLFYKWEIIFLIVAILIPILSWFIWKSGDMVSRSGSLIVFFSLLSEFKLLHKANVKHIRNAQRVLQNSEPLNFSDPAMHVTIASLFIALIGTFIWGYGDIFIAT
tara:strand:- start:1854 stop:2207 length:354 start_codon:yes stop_codon:yes gene_type:complete